MNSFFKFISCLISLPARIKGVKFGKNSFLGPGYDFLMVRLKGLCLGNDTLIGRNAWIEMSNNNSKIVIGDGTNIGRNVTISCKESVKIGRRCLLSYNVSILDYDHLFGKQISPMEGCYTEGREIVIGDDCFVGAHSFILKGVHLGEHCVVGANSVVTKSFPSYSVICGNPAKKIRILK